MTTPRSIAHMLDQELAAFATMLVVSVFLLGRTTAR
jgi:hypothetical protein